MFILPISDSPRPRGTPWMTYGIMAANILVFTFITLPFMNQPLDPRAPGALEMLRGIANQTGYDIDTVARHFDAYQLITYHWGFRPAEPGLLTILSSLFLHAGLWHLGANMLFLWIYGPNVERRLGPKRFLIAYLLMGIAATLFFMLFSLGSNTPLVGASGAISGVLGCYFLWFPKNTVRLIFGLFIFWRLVEIPARWVLGFYILVENIWPFMTNQAGPVAYGAHIGGFLGGLGIAYALDRKKAQADEVWSASFDPSRDASFEGGGTAFDEPSGIAELLRAGHVGVALRYYVRMPSAQQAALGHTEVFSLADALTEIGETQAAMQVLQRFIATHPTHAMLSRAHFRLGLLNLRRLERMTPARHHMLTVLDLPHSEQEAMAAREALREIETRTRRQLLH